MNMYFTAPHFSSGPLSETSSQTLSNPFLDELQKQIDKVSDKDFDKGARCREASWSAVVLYRFGWLGLVAALCHLPASAVFSANIKLTRDKNAERKGQIVIR